MLAQSVHVDSLRQVLLRYHAPDTTRVLLLLTLADTYQYVNFDSTIYFAVEGARLSRELSFARGTAENWRLVGVGYGGKGDYKEALAYFQKALTYFRRLKDKEGTAKVFNDIGSVYLQWGNYQLALENYLNGLRLREEASDKKGIAIALLNIGSLYEKQNNLVRSLDFYARSLQIAEAAEDLRTQATLFNNIGYNYEQMGEYLKSLENHRRSLKIREKAGDKAGVAMSLLNIGSVYERMNNDPEALAYQFRAKRMFEEIKDKTYLILALIRIARIYQKTGLLRSSLEYCQRSLVMAYQISSRERIKECIQTLSETYRLMGNYQEALRYYTLFTTYRDSLYSEGSNRTFQQLHTNYELDKRQKEIDLLRYSRSLQEEENKNQRLYITLLLAGVAFSSILAFFFYRSFIRDKRNNRILTQQAAELNSQKEDLSALNEELNDTLQIVNEQGRILSERNEEIHQINEELQGLNLYLEQRVQERTHALAEQYEKSLQYNFINGHLVRAPLARIQGLISLLQMEDIPENSRQLMGYLLEASADLDSVLHRIRDLLEESELEVPKLLQRKPVVEDRRYL